MRDVGSQPAESLPGTHDASAWGGTARNKLGLLQHVDFGARIAEDEVADLAQYFVETDQWKKIFAGKVDVVYGVKGSGKSAIYSLLRDRADELFTRGVLLVPAEEPRGAPAFKNLVADPPASQKEFVALWRLYFLCLVARTLKEHGLKDPSAERVVTALEAANLIESGLSLHSLLRGVLDYARQLVRVENVEGGLALDPSSGLPSGFTGRITFREPTSDERAMGLISARELLALANASLQGAGYTIWLVLDRLDVAFTDTEQLERNALQALFEVYGDLKSLDHIMLKVFLRTDIWRRITEEGFREASHIARQETISWNHRSLLNLVIRRCLKNEAIRAFYGVQESVVLANTSEQERLLYRIFPDQVVVGSRRRKSFAWMLSRTADGTGATAPRELIHLLSSMRDLQVQRLEIGDAEPEGERLFTGVVFREALEEVSHVRLEQTLYAEYPRLRMFIEKLDRRRTEQTLGTLGAIWALPPAETQATAEDLVDIGFFERRGTRDEPSFWVPFLYRDALSMVQGAEERVTHDPPALRFGRYADDYERGRPGWPSGALNDIHANSVLELASGTGKLTRQLVRRYARVIAVDPDARMREVAAQIVPEVRPLDGVAERIPLPDSSVEAVFVAAGFHWFEYQKAIREIARVLRPGGTLAVLENEWLDISPPLTPNANQILSSFNVDDERSGRARQRERGWFDPLLNYGFTVLSRKSFPFEYHCPSDNLVSYYISRTGSKASEDPEAAKELRRLLRAEVCEDFYVIRLSIEVLAFAAPTR